MEMRLSPQTRNRFLALLLACLAVTLILGSNGCMRTYRMSPEEVAASKRTHFNLIVIPASIQGAVGSPRYLESDTTRSDSTLKDSLTTPQSASQLIRFDSLGGSIDFNQQLVKGRTAKGDQIVIPFDSVVHVRFRGVDRGGIGMTLKEYAAAQELAARESPRRIKWRKLPCWDMVRFDHDKAVYDPSTGLISGRSAHGKLVSARLTDVRYLQDKEPNPYKTARISMSLIVLTAIALGVTHSLTP